MMNEGVKILLERMKTNPEEFIVSEGYPYEVGSGSKWHKLIESHKLYLNPEDNKVLEEALNGLMQQRFTERVMKELLDPHEDTQRELDLNTHHETHVNMQKEFLKKLSPQLLPSSNEVEVHRKPITKFGKLYTP